MAHLSAWLAEGGKQLEQIDVVTYHAGELDVEAANRRFSELTEGIPFEVVYVQAWASRWRMHGAWRDLTEITTPAVAWLDKVAGVLGHGDVFVVEGVTSERAHRSREVAFAAQLAHPGEGFAESRWFLLVHQAVGHRLQGGHRVHRFGASDCVATASAWLAPPDQPTSPVGSPMLPRWAR